MRALALVALLGLPLLVLGCAPAEVEGDEAGASDGSILTGAGSISLGMVSVGTSFTLEQ